MYLYRKKKRQLESLLDIVVLGVTVDSDRSDCSADSFSWSPVDRPSGPLSSASFSTGIPETNLNSTRNIHVSTMFKIYEMMTYAAWVG